MWGLRATPLTHRTLKGVLVVRREVILERVAFFHRVACALLATLALPGFPRAVLAAAAALRRLLGLSHRGGTTSRSDLRSTMRRHCRVTCAYSCMLYIEGRVRCLQTFSCTVNFIFLYIPSAERRWGLYEAAHDNAPPFQRGSRWTRADRQIVVLSRSFFFRTPGVARRQRPRVYTSTPPARAAPSRARSVQCSGRVGCPFERFRLLAPKFPP